MSAALLSISDFLDFFTSLFTFLPAPMASFVSSAILVVFSWLVISIAIKIVGMFF